MPGSLIRKPSVAAPIMPVVQAPPPPVPVPAQPQAEPPSNQPTTGEQILAEYQQKWGQAQRIASAKSCSKAVDYLRARKQEIITELSKKYNVTRQEVKGIVSP